MKIVNIIVGPGDIKAARIVAGAFHSAGLETERIELGENSDRNADLLIKSVADSAAHPLKVWLLSANAVELMCVDEDKAAASRRFIGLPPKSEYQSRMLITTDRAAGETPAGCITLSIADLEAGRISIDELRAYFA